jgi:hypothetical protein
MNFEELAKAGVPLPFGNKFWASNWPTGKIAASRAHRESHTLRACVLLTFLLVPFRAVAERMANAHR